MSSKLKKKLLYKPIKLSKTPTIGKNTNKKKFYGKLILSPYRNYSKPTLSQMVNYMEKQYNRILENSLKNEYLIQEKINSTNNIVNDFDASFRSNNQNKSQKSFNTKKNNKFLSPNKSKKNIEFNIQEKLNTNIDQEIKELQKIYYHVDQIDLLNTENKNINENISSPKTNKNVNNFLLNSYKYDDYASKINIYNHPKLYILNTRNIKYSNIIDKRNNRKINSKEIPCIFPEINSNKKNLYNHYLSEKQAQKEK